MPAYNASGWYVWFFLIYVCVNLYLFMSIVLAVIYSNYRKHLKDEVESGVFIKRRLLGRAFDMAACEQSGTPVITKVRV